MTFSITPQRLFKLLSAIVGILVLMHALMLIADYGLGRDNMLEVRTLFDLNREENIPTMFSALQLLLAGALLFVLHCESRKTARGDALYWLALAAVFAFLATDEFCELHEQLIGPMQRWLHVKRGALTFAWVVPYAALVAVFAAAFVRFWWRLPARSRSLFAIAAVIYVSGGIGMEMVGSKIFTIYGWHSFQFDLQTMFEEFMEMFGITLFVYALAKLIQQRVDSIKFSLVPNAESDNHELLQVALHEERQRAA